MHFFSFCLAFSVSWVVVYCLPKAHLKPAFKTVEEDKLEHARNMMAPAKGKKERGHESPYADTEIDSYLHLAREVADQYIEETWKADKDSKSAAGARTASEALRAFRRPSPRTQRMIKEIERENAELETLLLIASSQDSKMLRQLHNIDLTARSAQPDPTCNITINCSDTTNRTFVDGFEFRTIDGSCNNLNNYTYGMAGTQHRRLLPDAYEDGRWDIRERSVNSTRRPRNDVFLPSVRNVSNVVHNTTASKPDNDDAVSLALFYFMQFIDHDLAKTTDGEVGPNRDCCTNAGGFCMPIIVDVDEDYFTRNYCMDARRSFTLFRCNDTSGFQNQINEVTAYLDASMVYGSSLAEERLLRTYKGGHLKQSTREFMPNSTRPSNLACNNTQPDLCYEAGDTRADVHPGLTTYHTIFVRQHNRIAKQFAEIKTSWSDERIYQETRKIIGAQIQHIVYEEMLPILLRDTELLHYNVTVDYAYNASIDASMTQAFSMAYRYHNLMPHTFHLAKVTSDTVANYHQVNQELVFMNTSYMAGKNYEGIDEVTLGMVVSACPYVNSKMNNATRNLLFWDAEGDSFDLVALNLMRAREWGMPSYAEYRALCGLGNATMWDDLLNTTDADTIAKLRQVYPNVRDVDLWTGITSETKLNGSISGPTQTCLLAKHFANLKHGDRLWYEASVVFDADQLLQIKGKTSMARIMCANLAVTTMRANVFKTDSSWQACQTILDGDIDLSYWPN